MADLTLERIAELRDAVECDKQSGWIPTIDADWLLPLLDAAERGLTGGRGNPQTSERWSMSIDVKDFGDRLRAIYWRHQPDIVHLVTDSYVAELVQYDADLFRAVIADEAAKPQPDEPRAEVDVPEINESSWFEGIWKEIFPFTPLEGSGPTRLMHEMEDELAGRVAEATAERDRRIAELEKENARLGREVLAAGRLWAVNEYLDQQLADAQAEVERLSNYLIDTGEVIAQHGDGGDVTIDAPHLAREAEAVIVKLRQQLAERDATIERQKADNAEQLKKLLVADERLGNTAIYTASHVAGHTQVVLLDDFCRERAAREAVEQRATTAESERDELREAWNWIMSMGVGLPSAVTDKLNHRHCKPEDLLAAYHAEKGKVGE